MLCKNFQKKKGKRRISSKINQIIIFGASGRTGLWLVAEALARGHLVTAAVRNATKFESEISPFLEVFFSG
jgi:hypothetical protein